VPLEVHPTPPVLSARFFAASPMIRSAFSACSPLRSFRPPAFDVAGRLCPMTRELLGRANVQVCCVFFRTVATYFQDLVHSRLGLLDPPLT
jgi:hypothetical protein